jgi:hypothetical protein
MLQECFCDTHSLGVRAGTRLEFSHAGTSHGFIERGALFGA